MMLHCYCCGAQYERGKFQCCAAPKGMASHTWLEKWCRVEIEPGKKCNSCPRCGCAHRAPVKETGHDVGWTTPGDLAPKNRGQLRGQVKEWMPYRDPGEDG